MQTTNSDNLDLLGVVGVDVRLEQLQENVENINFLETGYSVLATAGDDGVVLAAPTRVWDRDAAESETTVCLKENQEVADENLPTIRDGTPRDYNDIPYSNVYYGPGIRDYGVFVCHHVAVFWL